MKSKYLLIVLLGMLLFAGLFLSLYFYTGTDEDALEAIAVGITTSLLTSAAMGK